MRIIKLLFLLLCSNLSFANKGSGEIYVDLEKLNSHKRVLYVAAHPDDENTRALAWFSLGEKAETAYFSLTRGDGGQNLIGNELSEELGILRTQELLAARSNDGARQYFSRALDFGYSKSAEESFEIWGKEGVLEDLVLMIRKFQPDVIITRFPPDERAGHGHHTASALLAIEAFEKAADPEFLKDQVAKYGVWKTTSVYWNTSYWWTENIKDLAEDDPDYLITDIGGYNSYLGKSYNEIGTIARSQHKCQGFGAVIERGSRIEYFQHLGGEKLSSSFFEKNNRTWQSMGSKTLDKKFQSLLAGFDFKNTANNVPQLLSILKDLRSLPDSAIKEEKIARCTQLILDCLGMHVELLGDDYAFVNGQPLPLKLNLINRSNRFVKLELVTLSTSERLEFNDTLGLNDFITKEISSNGNVSQATPFWIEYDGYTLTRGFETRFTSINAEEPPVISAYINLRIDGEAFGFPVYGTYKWGDPAYGERERSLVATPRYTANFEEKIALIKPGEEREVRIKIHSFQDNLIDTIRWKVLNDWKVDVKEIPIHIEKKHGEMWVTLKLHSQNSDPHPEDFSLTDSKGNPLFQYNEIAYDHIPTQPIMKLSSLRCISLDARINSGRVAYLKGVDDGIPDALSTLGFKVDIWEVDDLPNLDLSVYNSVVLGIRIYNVHPELRNYDDQLFRYVENGGNLVMQYNTASRSGTNAYGPKSFSLSRDRVTEEDAEVSFLAPEHRILSEPNKISEHDFEGWVQERGLYFANEWDEAYTPVLSWHDRGEEPLDGALLVMNYGKGQFVYTGISFFRELPNGVVGAYRLFANIMSYKP